MILLAICMYVRIPGLVAAKSVGNLNFFLDSNAMVRTEDVINSSTEDVDLALRQHHCHSLVHVHIQVLPKFWVE